MIMFDFSKTFSNFNSILINMSTIKSWVFPSFLQWKYIVAILNFFLLIIAFILIFILYKILFIFTGNEGYEL